MLCALMDLIPTYLLKGRVIAYDQRPLSVHILVLESLSEEVNAKLRGLRSCLAPLTSKLV